MRTAEAVAPGHPDKICDQISDAILDDILRQDPTARVAIETMGGHGIITITGELTTTAFCYMDRIAKQVYRELGYTDEIGVQVNVVSQSPDIAQGVDTGGAGDQGIMVGYACSDNEAMIPQELYLARKLLRYVIEMTPWGPDGKSQVTLNDDGTIEKVVLSVMGDFAPFSRQMAEETLGMTIGQYLFNPTGRFVVGGFAADTGLTGRKIVQDAYGPQVAVGGGAFSGKDPSKVDRSAAYMARKIACDAVRAGAMDATVKLAYSIGIAEPMMATLTVDGRRTDVVGYDLRPHEIVSALNLMEPQYQRTAQWGHFGHGFGWDL